MTAIIDKPHFFLQPMLYSSFHLPGRSNQPQSCSFGIEGGRLKHLDNAALPIGAEIDLKKVSDFVRSHVQELSLLKRQNPALVDSLVITPIQSLITEHNDRVENSLLIRILTVALLILTFGAYSYKNEFLIDPIPTVTAQQRKIELNRDSRNLDANRAAVRDKTKIEVNRHLADPNSAFGKEVSNVCLYTNDDLQYDGSKVCLLPHFDVLQVPFCMDYDEKWELRTGKQEYLFAHHVAAPDVGSNEGFAEYSYQGRFFKEKYLGDMGLLFESTLKAQTQSGATDAVWVPLGMGAFLRGLKDKDPNYADQKEDLNLRQELAKLFFEAVKKQPSLHIHLCLVSQGPDKANKEAFESVLQERYPELVNRVTVAIDEDATQIAQDLANENGPYTVSLMNAANKKLIGNHWFGKGALSAIDENFHRRSSMASYYAARLNGYTAGFREQIQQGAGVLLNTMRSKGLGRIESLRH